jgi:hypothetical protein
MSLLFRTAPHPARPATRALQTLSAASVLALVLGVAGCLAPGADDADADPTAPAAEADHVNHGPAPVFVGSPRGVVPLPVVGPVVVVPPRLEGPEPHWSGPGRPPPWWGHDGWDGPPGHRHPHHPR